MERMNMNTCPNCGAQVVGNKCEYCGTIFNNTQEKYKFNHEQEDLYLRLDLLHKIDLEEEIEYVDYWKEVCSRCDTVERC